ncbi:hypothetical protein DWX71_10700 [Ruminococcus bromii]|nr:hypothetical protein DWX71_10700 [Ruminococcus bromii]
MNLVRLLAESKSRNKKVAYYENEDSLKTIRQKYYDVIQREKLNVFVLDEILNNQLSAVKKNNKRVNFNKVRGVFFDQLKLIKIPNRC